MNKNNYLWITKLMLGIYLIPALIWGAPPKGGLPAPTPKPGITKPKPGSSPASPKGGVNATPPLKGGLGALPANPVKIGDLITDLIDAKPLPPPTFPKEWGDLTATARGGSLNNSGFHTALLNPNLSGRGYGTWTPPPNGIYTFDGIKPYLSPALLALMEQNQINVNIPIIIQRNGGSVSVAAGQYHPPSSQYPQGHIVLQDMALIRPASNGSIFTNIDMVLFHEIMHAMIDAKFYARPDIMVHLHMTVLEKLKNNFDYAALIKQGDLARFESALLKVYEEIEIYYREYLIWKSFGKIDPTYSLLTDVDMFKKWAEAEKLGAEHLKKAILDSILKEYGPRYFPDFTDVITQEDFINAILNSSPPEFVTLPW